MNLKGFFKRKSKPVPPPAPSPLPPTPPPSNFLVPRSPLLRPLPQPPPLPQPLPPTSSPPTPPPLSPPSPSPLPVLLTPPPPLPRPRLQRRPTPRPQRRPFFSPSTCPTKPVAFRFNTATGGYFGFCSNECAEQARSPGEWEEQAHSLCEYCNKRPKFKDGTKVHAYCGLTCTNRAKTHSSQPNPPPDSPLLTGSAHLDPQLIPPGPTCRTPGCPYPVFVYLNGTLGDYCTVAHEGWGKRGCISCRAAPMSKVSVLCRPCHKDALSRTPVIVEVPEDHENYKSVEKQFKQSWRHKTTCPEVQAIYKIIVAEASLRQYQQYQDSVEGRGNFVAKGKSRGNENRRWHGTKRKCNLGDQGCKTFCADSACSLCRIIKTSFDVKFFKAATGWGRFGHGIYTSSTSSKSNDYSKNIGINSEWKALLLNKVIVGKGKKLTKNNTSLTQPPPGYDSVLAEVVPGGFLNYDELVVYNNEAVRPSYLVMYKSP
ncbi:hypothetical protein BJ322DRAFT_1036993 [Thelephora terrestris]|uniref:Poly [ADP-ribose] polymerase n=1 Tax=Thelephora terrestris TaxID=56493 RepID=A0A9P6HNQ3_9AGAM|nr:hypothetical protein BJ322DRAFT_1036993 [Thelephora terrestris]